MLRQVAVAAGRLAAAVARHAVAGVGSAWGVDAEGSVGDAGEVDLVELPTGRAAQVVGTDAEAQLHRLSGVAGTKAGGGGDKLRVTGAVADEALTIGQGGVLIVDLAVVAADSEARADVGPGRAVVHADLDDAAVVGLRSRRARRIIVEAVAVAQGEAEAAAAAYLQRRRDQPLIGRRGGVGNRPPSALAVLLGSLAGISISKLLIGGVVLLGASALRGEAITELPTLKSMLALAYLIFFGAILGFTAYVYLLQNVRPALATSYAYVNPVVAVALGVWLAGEQVDVLEMAAMVVILAGVVLVCWPVREARSA